MRKRKVYTIRYCGQWRITLWSNDEIRDEEKMMVVLEKFVRSPGENWRRNVEIGFSEIYVTNISVQSALGTRLLQSATTKDTFPRWWFFLYYLHWIINIKIKSHSILHYLQSADLSKKSFNWLCHRNIWLCQYWLFSVNGQLSFLSIISIDLKVWGYPALLISWFINFKVSRVLNYAMKSPIFTESLLISIHLVKIFQFFLCAFTWNRPSTT